jgi:hypothetical protein
MAVLGSRSSRKRKLSSMSFSTEGGFSGNRSSISAARTRTRCSVRVAAVIVTFHSSGPSASMVVIMSFDVSRRAAKILHLGANASSLNLPKNNTTEQSRMVVHYRGALLPL